MTHDTYLSAIALASGIFPSLKFARALRHTQRPRAEGESGNLYTEVWYREEGLIWYMVYGIQHTAHAYTTYNI
jgi:hypothetical protein